MSEEKELKLACLHQAGGDLDHAQRLFDWVSGSVRATPDSEAAEVSAPKQDKPQQSFNYRHPSKYGTDVPRRCYLEELTPEERAIRDLVDTVERLGAHPLLTATVIQLMKAGEDLADWVDIGLRDKAIAALSPGNDLGLFDENPAAGDTEVRNQAEGEAGEPKMFWYASGNEEDFAIGPCGTREEAIEQALDDEVGISTDLKRQVIFVMQAYQEPLKLSRMISVDAILDRAMDGLLGDAAGDEGEPDQLVDHIKQEQWKALEAKLRETMDAWQAEGDIVVTPYVFTRSTKPEAVCYLCVGEEQVVARKWEDAPFEGVMDAKHVADDDTYALINGEWFGPLPEGAHAPIGAAEITADAERISVVTDQDRVEQADLLLENQPGVSSQASLAEAAVPEGWTPAAEFQFDGLIKANQRVPVVMALYEDGVSCPGGNGIIGAWTFPVRDVPVIAYRIIPTPPGLIEASADAERIEVASEPQTTNEQEQKDEGLPVLDAGDIAEVLREGVPSDALLSTFADGKLYATFGGSTYLVIDSPKDADAFKETEPSAAYAHINEIDEPAGDAAVFAHGILTEAKEPPLPSWLSMFMGKAKVDA